MKLIELDSYSIFIISHAEQMCNYNKEILKVILGDFKEVQIFQIKIINAFYFPSPKKKKKFLI